MDQLVGWIIALSFWGFCIYVVVVVARPLVRLLRRGIAPSPRSLGTVPRSIQPTSSTWSNPSTGTSRQGTVDPFPGLDAEIRARVAAQTAAEALRSAPKAQPVPAPTPDGVPDQLPVRIKGYFLARSEAAFLAALEASLPGGYRVFPNVRLNDLFLITAREYGVKKGTYARLRDKHVDFLVVSLPDHRPVFAIELDGASHDNAQQQYRDAVKDVAFRSAGLPLIRLRAEVTHTPASLKAVLGEHLSIGRVLA